MLKSPTAAPMLKTPTEFERVPVPELTSEQQTALEQFRARMPWVNVDRKPLDPHKTTAHEEEVEITAEGAAGSRASSARSAGSAARPLTPTQAELEQHGVPEHDVDQDDLYWQTYYESFCDTACLLRYLRARSWNIDQAYSALRETLRWRRRYKPHLICPEEIESEANSGKDYLNGFDKFGRPILYLRNHRENSKDHAKQIRLLIFNLEMAIRMMPEGVERFVLIFDFGQYSPSNAPPMNISKYFLHIFASHYPERLGLIMACSAPWYFWAFYKLISPFIHPITKSKIRFVDLKSMHKVSESDGTWGNPLHYVDQQVLEKDFGGDNAFDYEHAVYWPCLQQQFQELVVKP
jgi:hypothetical protein